MFNDYYYIDKLEPPIYFSIITLNNAVETTLYQGNKLIKRKSLQKGVHILEKDNLKLKVQIKWFKAIPELRQDNVIIIPQKLKRKELRIKLKEHNISNELNPKEVAKKPFKILSLKAPAILLSIGALWQIIFDGKGKFWDVPSMIIFVIAYIYLFGSFIDKVPDRHMDEETKGKFKFIIGIVGMIFTQIIIGKLITLFK